MTNHLPPRDRRGTGHRRSLWSVLLTVGLLGGSAPAQEPSTFDRIWSLAVLHENPESSVVQKFALSGRLQPESAWFDADQGDFSDDFTWRRFRFGFKADVFRQWILHLEGDFDLNGSVGDMYTRLTDAYVGWSPRDDLRFRVLKHSTGFTLDGATSSKRLLTLQRNALTENLWFTREYFTGFDVRGKLKERWDWRAGVYSQDGSDELSAFEAGYFLLLSMSHRLDKHLDLDQALLRLDVVLNQEDPASGTRDFSRVLSLVSQWKSGRWGWATDLAAGRGYFEQSDVWGLVVMAHHDVTARTQVVARYTHVTSADDNGVRLPRYANRITADRGNRYDEFYAGLNVYFHGHEFKWQTGLEHGTLLDDADDGGRYDGWGLSTGLRFSW